MPHLIDGDERAAVLATACDRLLEQYGPAGLTWRAISLTSGVSTSSMSHHLQDRERLLRVCSHVSSRARLARLTRAVIERGPVGVLPWDHDDLPATRSWLGWLEVGRTDPSIGASLSRDRRQELAVLGRSLDHRLAPADLLAVQALVDGLRVAVCMPGSEVTVRDAQACLAARLSEMAGLAGLTATPLEPGVPLVAPEDWGFPFVPGQRRVTPYFVDS